MGSLGPGGCCPSRPQQGRWGLETHGGVGHGCTLACTYLALSATLIQAPCCHSLLWPNGGLRVPMLGLHPQDLRMGLYLEMGFSKM